LEKLKKKNVDDQKSLRYEFAEVRKGGEKKIAKSKY
jgi:hypothetical protein